MTDIPSAQNSGDFLEETPRRAWIGRLVGGATAVALTLVGCGPGEVDELTRSPSSPGTTRGALSRFSDSSRLLQSIPESPLGTLRVARLPDNYRFGWALLDPLDGFSGALRTFVVHYHNSGLKLGFRHPLAVYVGIGEALTFASLGPALPASTTTMEVAGFGFVEVEYFDGMWQMPTDEDRKPKGVPFWAVGRGHAVVCRTANCAIAVRGSVEAGVSRQVLHDVLSGLEFV